MCDSLAPLAIREPPVHDPDENWGLTDGDPEPLITRKKKDSGYSSGIFEPFVVLNRCSTNSYVSITEPMSLNRLLHNYSKTVTHTESQPDLRSTYERHKGNELPRRTEFAGGLINIDNAIKKQPSIPSIAASHTGRWATSISQHASSLISSLRHHRRDKDQYNYKLLLKVTDEKLADQLTWIEYELFSKIQV